MAGKAGGTGLHLPLDREKPPARSEHSTDLGETGRDILPVVHGRDRPRGRHGMFRQRQVFGAALRPHDIGPVPGDDPGQPKHKGRRIHTGDACAAAGRRPDGSTGAATDIDGMVRTRQARHLDHQASTLTRESQHAERDEESERPGKTMAFGMVVDREV